MENNSQLSLVLLKPDAMSLSLSGYIFSQLSEFHTGLCFAGLKVVKVSDMLAGEHYAEHKGKGFFASLLQYIKGELHYSDDSKRRVIALVYKGEDAVAKIRALCGPTNPLKAREEKPGCIRSLGALVPIVDAEGNTVGDRMDNLIHASANTADAEREIKLWFRPNDIPPAMRQYATRTADKFYYYDNGKLTLEASPTAVCLVAPCDTVWATDLDALEAISEGKESNTTLESVAAKYMINEAK